MTRPEEVHIKAEARLPSLCRIKPAMLGARFGAEYVPLDRLSRRDHPAGKYVTAPAHSLVVQSQRALESTASTNGDGFGMGWYGQSQRNRGFTARSGRPGRTRTCAISAAISARISILRMCAPRPGTPITRPNCHPFACGRWMFMHNGLVGNWSRLRRPGRGADSGRGLRLAHRHHQFGGGLSRHSGRRRRQGSDRGDHADMLATLTDMAWRPKEPLRFTAGARQRPRPLRLPLCRQRQRQYRCTIAIRRTTSWSSPSRSTASAAWKPVPPGRSDRARRQAGRARPFLVAQAHGGGVVSTPRPRPTADRGSRPALVGGQSGTGASAWRER